MRRTNSRARRVSSKPKRQGQQKTKRTSARGKLLQVAVDDIEVEDAERDYGAIDGLADSINDVDIIAPLIVKPKPGEGGKWVLVVGRRRYRAAKAAGKDNVPVLVREPADDSEELRIQIGENAQQHQDPVELGERLLKLKFWYEDQHPETKLGATGGKDGRSKAGLARSDNPVDRFTLEFAKRLGMSETRIKDLLAKAQMSEERKAVVRQAAPKDRNKVANAQLKAHRREKPARANAKRASQPTDAGPSPLDVLVAASQQARRSMEGCRVDLEEFLKLAEAAPAEGVEVDPVLEDISTLLQDIDSITDLGLRLSSLTGSHSNASDGATDDALTAKHAQELDHDEGEDDEDRDDDDERDDEDREEQTPSPRPPPNAPRALPRRSAIAAGGRQA